MEKLLDRHIRDEISELCVLHQQQFVYQPGKSTETKLRHVIMHIEEEVENKEVALAAFLVTEGAFRSISCNIIIKATKQHGLET